jgi:transcriptional regulator with XRE-family HTH domain
MRELTVAGFLTSQIEKSGKTQTQIALETGFPRSNFITMLKQGSAKVPIRKVPALAKALGVEPALFLRVVLNEYQPEMLATLESVLGPLPTATETVGKV